MTNSAAIDPVQQRLTRGARVVFALFAAWYVGRPVLQPFDYVLLRDIILATHEAGHVLFMPFGEFLMVLGGSLFQVVVPCVFVGYFARRRDWYAAAILLLWVAFAMTDLAHYIGDARTRQLPLLGGDPSGHDWTFLLVQTGLLEHDRRLAGGVRGLGILLYCVAVAGALYAAWWQDHVTEDNGVADAAGAVTAGSRGANVRASRWRES